MNVDHDPNPSHGPDDIVGRLERRRHPRLPVDRPAKLLRHETGRYAVARTRDISASGVLLELLAPSPDSPDARPLRVGETVGVGIAWTTSAVVRDRAVTLGRVTRVLPIEPHTPEAPRRQQVAIHFAKADTLAADWSIAG